MPVSGPAKSVIEAFDFAWERFSGRLAGLSDDEYFWEPVQGCWSLRVDSSGHWSLDGGGGGGPAPDPVPFTTIAWRIGHLAGLALHGFADRMFGAGSATRDTLDFPSTAAAVPEYVADCYGEWRRGMSALQDDEWERPLGPAWGPYAEATVLDLALHVLDEVIHHAAEVGVLRDLYSSRRTLGQA